MARFLPGLVSGRHLAVRALTVVNEAMVIPNPIRCSERPPAVRAVNSGGRRDGMPIAGA